ncbi:hypothetical protein [Sphingomonas sp. 28-63-12]|uniref:hypothetical protein n=1 Tax=Sphingomonas sp. 28-63-12 TaxID=1970434 RepID=UPI000BD0FED6|nr:MAG: hypothetical protein B7Y47_10150 [Sphingomonas sp. 28-63-12]
MLFEVGKEYWITYGTAEEQSFASIKVVEVEGSWLKVESDKLDMLINVAAPFFISARDKVELPADSIYAPLNPPQR